MSWVMLTAVGFLVLTALVIALARSSTARWEREKRVARVPRHPAPPPPSLPERAAQGVRGAVVRWTVTAVHLRTPLPAPLNAVAGLLVTTTRQAVARVRPGPEDDQPPAAEEPSQPTGPVDGVPSRGAHSRRGRALRLLHRHDPGDGAPVARAGGDGNPTAR
jgi:hypothetical protein